MAHNNTHAKLFKTAMELHELGPWNLSFGSVSYRNEACIDQKVANVPSAPKVVLGFGQKLKDEKHMFIVSVKGTDANNQSITKFINITNPSFLH